MYGVFTLFQSMNVDGQEQDGPANSHPKVRVQTVVQTTAL